MDNTRHTRFHWNYDSTELWMDGIVHVLGVLLAITGAALLLVLAIDLTPGEYVSVSVYLAGLVTVLGVSAIYNMWPVSPVKWLLRRFDHSAIYLLIAGTYTPFMTQMKTSSLSTGLLVGVWTTSVIGIALKLLLPGRFDRLSILFYLGISWSGIVFYEAIFAELPISTLAWLGAGGVLYTVGVIFHVWERLRFHNAIWHAFVLLAASCHYGAVLDLMVLARA
ncbi:PAQR family membrane homeostasis protein TrhA [Microvirga pudoricolor]|uniref:PAQR family membrane homeostasis protein TrhA n=1 Tax=Microvirga pudoricolor TaxID=2778729 RepID=UPI0019507924|nr:hemolysin III family protein [Microvirga pudoricolor]MBM6596150.1 hemolysin III family protein [Microvirga pudoricolor]